MNSNPGDNDFIQVAVRVRPLIKREIKAGESAVWGWNNNEVYSLDDTGRDCFTFDYVLGTESTNHELYNFVRPIVEQATHGINGTVFAYGQTSSGKTHSIMGDDDEPGIIPLAINDIFAHIETNNTNRKFLIRACYMEIYNERINDLLDVTARDLKIREDLQGVVSVKAKEEITRTREELMKVVTEGNKNRRIGETQMNDKSSRSHVILQIIIESSEEDDGDKQDAPVQVSSLFLVDLAGSERVAQTKATGTRLKEGGHINKSLSVLSLVMQQLSGKQEHISFRDSKLTRILSNALGGNAKTLIIATITPVSYENTVSTLQFAKCAKTIMNRPRVNEILTESAMIKRYQQKEKKLIKELENEKEKNITLQIDRTVKDKKIKHLEEMLTSIRKDFVACKTPTVSKIPKRRHTSAFELHKKTVMTTTPTTFRKPLLLPTNLPSISDEGHTQPPAEEFRTPTSKKMVRWAPQPMETPVAVWKQRYKDLDESHIQLKEFQFDELETAINYQKDLEMKLEEMEEKMATAEQERKKSEGLMKDYQSKFEQRDIACSEVELQLSFLTQKHSARERDLLAKLQEQMEQLDRYKDLENEMYAMKREHEYMDEMKKCADGLKRQLEELEVESVELKTQRDRYLKECEELKSIENEKKQYLRKHVELLVANNDLKNIQIALPDSCAIKGSVHENITVSPSSRKQVEVDFDFQIDSTDSLEKLEEELKYFNAIVAECHKLKSNLAEMDTLQVKLEEREEQFTYLNNQNKLLEEKIMEMEVDHKKYIEDKDTLITSLENLSKELNEQKKLAEDKDLQITTLQELRKELGEQHKLIQEKNATIESFEDLKKTLDEQKKLIEAKNATIESLDDFKKELDDLKQIIKEKEHISSTVNELEIFSVDLKIEIEEKAKEIQEKNAEIESLIKTNTGIKSAVKLLNAAIEENNDEIKLQMLSNAGMSINLSETENISDEIKHICSSLTARVLEINELRNQLLEKDKEIKAFSINIEELKSTLTAKEHELLSAKSRFDEQKRKESNALVELNMSSALDETDIPVKALKSKLHLMEGELARLKNQLLDQTHTEKHSELEMLKSTLELKQMQLEELQVTLDEERLKVIEQAEIIDRTNANLAALMKSFNANALNADEKDAKMASLRATLSNKEGEIVELKKRLNISEHKFKEVQKEVEEVTDELMDKITLVEQHEKTIEKHEKTIEQHVNVIEQHKKSIVQHKETIDQHEKTITQHENTIVHHEKTIEQHENSIKQYMNTIKGQVNSIEQHMKSIEQQEEIICQHEKTVVQHQKTIVQHEEMIAQYEKTIEKNVTLIAQHEKTIEQNKEKNLQQEKTIEQYMDTIDHHVKSIAQQEEIINTHKKIIVQHEETIVQHEKTIDQYMNTIDQHVISIAQQEEKIGNHEETIAHHEETIVQHKKIIEQHVNTIDQHVKSILQKEEIISKHEKTIEQYMETIKQHEKTIEELKGDNALESIKTQLVETQVELKQIKNDYNLSLSDLKKSQDSFNRAQDDLKHANADINRVQNELEHSNDHLARAKEELEQTKGNFNQASADYERAQKELEQAKDAFAQLQDEIKQSNVDYGRVQNELEQTKNDLAQAQVALKDLNELKTKLELAHQELGQVKESEGMLREELCRANEEIDSLRMLQHDLQQLRDDLSKAYMELEKVTEGTGDLKQVRSECYQEEELRGAKEKLEASQNSVLILKKQLEESMKEERESSAFNVMSLRRQLEEAMTEESVEPSNISIREELEAIVRKDREDNAMREEGKISDLQKVNKDQEIEHKPDMKKIYEKNEINILDFQKIIQEKENNICDLQQLVQEHEKNSLELKQIIQEREHKVRDLQNVLEEKEDLNKLLLEKDESQSSDVKKRTKEKQSSILDLKMTIREKQNNLRKLEKCVLDLQIENKMLATELRQESLKVVELQKQLDTARIDDIQRNLSGALEVAQKALEIKTKEFAVSQIAFEDKTKEFNVLQSNLADKSKELNEINKSFEEQSLEFGLLQRNFDEKSKEFDLIQNTLDNKTKEFDIVQRTLEEKSKDLDVTQKALEEKSKNLDVTQKALEDNLRNYDLTQKALKEKSNELELMQSSIQQSSNDVNVLQNQLADIHKSHQRAQQELGLARADFKRKCCELEVAQKNLDDSLQALAVVKKNLQSETNALDETEFILEDKTKELEEMQSCLNETKIDLEAKSKELEGTQRSLRETYKTFEVTERKLVEKSKELEDTQTSLRETSKTLEVTKRNLVEKSKELEDTQTRLHETSKTLEVTKRNLEEKSKALDSIQLCLLEKTKELDTTQSTLNEKLKELDLIKRSAEENSKSLDSLKAMLQQKETLIIKQREELNNKEVDPRMLFELQKEKAKELGLIQKSLQETKQALDLAHVNLEVKTRELQQIQLNLNEKTRKLDEKNTDLDAMRKDLGKMSKELYDTRNKLEVTSQELTLDVSQKNSEVKTQELGVMQRNLGEMVQTLDATRKHLGEQTIMLNRLKHCDQEKEQVIMQLREQLRNKEADPRAMYELQKSLQQQQHAEREKFKSLLTERDEHIQSLNEQVKSNENELRNRDECIYRLSDELNQIKNGAEGFDALRKELEKKDKCISNLKEELEKINLNKSEKSELQKNMTEFSDRLDEYQSVVSNYEILLQGIIVDKYQCSEVQLECGPKLNFEQLKTKLVQLLSTTYPNEDSGSENEIVEKLKEEKEHLNVKVQECYNRIMELDHANSNLRMELAEKNQSLRKYIENKGGADELMEVDEGSSNMQEIVERQKLEITDLKLKVDELQESNEHLDAEVLGCLDRIKQLEGIIDAREATIKDLETNSENGKIMKELNQYKSAVNEFEENIQRLKEENKQLEYKVADYLQKMHTYKENIRKLKGHMAEKENSGANCLSCVRLKMQINSLQQRMKQQDTKISSEQTSLSRSPSNCPACKQMQEKNKELEKNCGKLQQELEKAEKTKRDEEGRQCQEIINNEVTQTIVRIEDTVGLFRLAELNGCTTCSSFHGFLGQIYNSIDGLKVKSEDLSNLDVKFIKDEQRLVNLLEIIIQDGSLHGNNLILNQLENEMRMRRTDLKRYKTTDNLRKVFLTEILQTIKKLENGIHQYYDRFKTANGKSDCKSCLKSKQFCELILKLKERISTTIDMLEQSSCPMLNCIEYFKMLFDMQDQYILQLLQELSPFQSNKEQKNSNEDSAVVELENLRVKYKNLKALAMLRDDKLKAVAQLFEKEGYKVDLNHKPSEITICKKPLSMKPEKKENCSDQSFNMDKAVSLSGNILQKLGSKNANTNPNQTPNIHQLKKREANQAESGSKTPLQNVNINASHFTRSHRPSYQVSDTSDMYPKPSGMSVLQLMKNKEAQASNKHHISDIQSSPSILQSIKSKETGNFNVNASHTPSNRPIYQISDTCSNSSGVSVLQLMKSREAQAIVNHHIPDTQLNTGSSSSVLQLMKSWEAQAIDNRRVPENDLNAGSRLNDLHKEVNQPSNPNSSSSSNSNTTSIIQMMKNREANQRK